MTDSGKGKVGTVSAGTGTYHRYIAGVLKVDTLLPQRVQNRKQVIGATMPNSPGTYVRKEVGGVPGTPVDIPGTVRDIHFGVIAEGVGRIIAIENTPDCRDAFRGFVNCRGISGPPTERAGVQGRRGSAVTPSPGAGPTKPFRSV